MKPVNQTKLGPVEGNCFAACIASLLEVPIEEVTIDVEPNHDNWWQTLQDYLKPKNLFFWELRLDYSVNYPLYPMDGIYCVMSGKSPREYPGHKVVNHAVIGRINSSPDKLVEFNMIHDPHPDKTFLKPNTLWGLGFLMALDPAQPTKPSPTGRIKVTFNLMGNERFIIIPLTTTFGELSDLLPRGAKLTGWTRL